jgi:hypothetical protein
MKTTTDSPNERWYSQDRNDNKLYIKFAKKLDKVGKIIYLLEYNQDTLHPIKERIYALPKGVILLSETTNTSLNKYIVSVKVDVYANSNRTAKKLLEEIIK